MSFGRAAFLLAVVKRYFFEFFLLIAHIELFILLIHIFIAFIVYLLVYEFVFMVLNKSIYSWPGPHYAISIYPLRYV